MPTAGALAGASSADAPSSTWSTIAHRLASFTSAPSGGRGARKQLGRAGTTAAPKNGKPKASLPHRHGRNASALSLPICWDEKPMMNMVLYEEDRCAHRFDSVARAQAACASPSNSWCGAVTQDGGIRCRNGAQVPSNAPLLKYELRSAAKDEGAVMVGVTSWLMGHEVAGACTPVKPKAFRYREWGHNTRHARGDAYPMYTLDTLRNLADHLFDVSTGFSLGEKRARAVKPCDVVYSTLRPTNTYTKNIHAHIRVPYLLISDTADDPITHSHATNSLLESPSLAHWWAVDNEVLDDPKLDSIPLGVMDSFELGKPGVPSSSAFQANVTEYMRTLLSSQSQPKAKWLMMQMTETHAERRGVRATFKPSWGEGPSHPPPKGEEPLKITPERQGKMDVRTYLMYLGQHRFVLSPRGNGLDAHRTWEALLVGSIPIVRSSALNPLYDMLPVLIVKEWADVTPGLLRDFHANYTARRNLYQYERLFADYWIGQVGVQRERCLAEERAKRAPSFVYDYHQKGGWVALDSKGARQPTPKWTAPGAVPGG